MRWEDGSRGAFRRRSASAERGKMGVRRREWCKRDSTAGSPAVVDVVDGSSRSSSQVLVLGSRGLNAAKTVASRELRTGLLSGRGSVGSHGPHGPRRSLNTATPTVMYLTLLHIATYYVLIMQSSILSAIPSVGNNVFVSDLTSNSRSALCRPLPSHPL